MGLTQIGTDGIKDQAVTNPKLPPNVVGNSEMKDDAINSSEIVNGAVDIVHLSATGTASSSTFLRGDNSWVTPTDTNTQLAFANDANNRVVTGDGSGGLNGEANLTFDGSTLDCTGKLRVDISSTGTAGSGSAEGIFLRNTNETDNNAVTIFGGADDYSAAASAINFINVDHSANAGAISFDTRTTGNSYAERLRIDSSGNVGINESVSNMVNGKLTVKIDTNKHIGFNGGQGEVGSVPALVSYQDNGSLQSLGFRGVDIRFADASSERLRVESGGDVKVVDGDLVIGTSGHGIDFSATADGQSSPDEVLADYESGQWTPVCGYESGGGSVSNTGYGFYTKVGDIVHFSVYVNDLDYTSAGTNWPSVSLPFAVSNISGNYSAVTFAYWNCFGTGNPFAYAQKGTSQFVIGAIDAGLDSNSGNTWAGTNRFFMATGSYRAA